MELALYCPVFGYYEGEGDKIGRRGDYYTSVSTGSLFGELLACQFAEWLSGGSPRLIEAGAHRAELARDILVWLRDNRPALFGQLNYLIVEPSERRRAWQRETLRTINAKVQWLERVDEISRPVSGLAPSAQSSRDVIFSNELLDSMPVHRLRWSARQRAWFECGVAFKEGRFVWERMANQLTRKRTERNLRSS